MESPLSPTNSAASRQRKKLQKNGAKKRLSIFGRPGTSLSFFSPPTEEKNNDAKSQQRQGRPTLALSPDLSDAKWAAYIRESVGLNSPDSSPQPSPRSERPPPLRVIPELSHLAIGDAKVPASPSSSSVDSPASSTARLRRQAKTPVRSIGQLERAKRPPLPTAIPTDNIPSPVELIAQEYRDLLESRNSILADADETRQVHIQQRPQQKAPFSTGASPPPLPGTSPISDDGTLVSFEGGGETVYFKPYSFSPALRSSIRSLGLLPASSTTHLAPGSLGLRLCLELLTRELAAGVGSRAHRSGTSAGGADAAGLQVLTMIEAYERLRERLRETRGRGGGGQAGEAARQLDGALDVWLRALYAVHDEVAGSGRPVSRGSESDYDAFDLEDLE